MESPEVPRPRRDAGDGTPAWLAGTLAPTGVERRDWQRSIAPAYIGLFLWLVYFDQIPATVLGRGGLLNAVVGCGIGAGLCYLLLYLGPALLGHRSGHGFLAVAAGAFGLRATPWIPGLTLVVAQVVVAAASIGYGTSLCFWGLELLGLLDRAEAGPLPPSPGFWRQPGFLVTAAAWGLATTMVGGHLVRLIIALMVVYAFVPAAILAGSTLAAFRGLPGFDPASLGDARDLGGGPPALVTAGLAVQFLMGFFAPSALLAADWGAATREARDVREGGAVSVGLAAWIVATLALLGVAGAAGLGHGLAPGEGGGDVFRSTYQESLIALFGARGAGAAFQLLALTTLAPACYAGYHLHRWPHDWIPALSRNGWTLLLLAPALALVASGWIFRLSEVFGVLGALCAPVAGVLSGEACRSRGRWAGLRAGVHPPGVLAWGVGITLGLTAPAAGALGAGALLAHPWTLYAYLAAFIVYLLSSAFGLGAPTIEPPGAPGSAVGGEQPPASADALA